jgi:acetylcholinesterase
MAAKYSILLVTTLVFVRQVVGGSANLETPLTISGPFGKVSGFVNPTTSPNVAQFLGIPYAEDPTGKLRFTAPVAKSPLPGVFNAAKLGPSCPQYNTSTPTFFSVAKPEYYIEGPMAEECLSLNVWTPLSVVKFQKRLFEDSWLLNGSEEPQTKLPVIIFLHGGQFTVGGSRVAYHQPERWVDRSQKHIVVTIKSALPILSHELLLIYAVTATALTSSVSQTQKASRLHQQISDF